MTPYDLARYLPPVVGLAVHQQSRAGDLIESAVLNEGLTVVDQETTRSVTCDSHVVDVCSGDCFKDSHVVDTIDYVSYIILTSCTIHLRDHADVNIKCAVSEVSCR